MSVKVSDLTNEVVTATEGTGILDILLEKMDTRIQEQYDEGRITGSDFASAYVGLFNAVLSGAIQWALNQDKAAMEAAAARATVEKQWGYLVSEDTDGDWILGASSGQGLIDNQITDAENKVDLTIGQVAKVYADIALVGQQQESERAQTTDPDGGLLKAKQDLIEAQTLGFASDTKQKVLKQMLEGYAVTLSIAGSATAPDATKEPQIDALTGEILADVGSSVNIP